MSGMPWSRRRFQNLNQHFDVVEGYMLAIGSEKQLSHNRNAMRTQLLGLSNTFLNMFYHSKMWAFSKYRGISTYKFPTDSWILQEIISEIQPDVIIETGTFKGGTSLFYADLLNALGKGVVVSIDIEQDDNLPKNDRIIYIQGDSTSKEVVSKVADIVKGKDTVMVDLDSYHTKEHVIKELRLYSPFVTEGSYLVVEDTVIGGHPVHVKNGDGRYVNPGPYEAVMEFLEFDTKDFEIDKNRTRFLITASPDGYLRRIQ